MRLQAAAILALLAAACSTGGSQTAGEARPEYSPHDAAMRELLGPVRVCRVTEYDVSRDDGLWNFDSLHPAADYTLAFSPGGNITSDELYIYRYGDRGELTSARSVDFPGTFGHIGRDSQGRVTEIVNKNQLAPEGDWRRAVIWNGDGRVAAVSTDYVGWSDSYTYTYDQNGRLARASYYFQEGANVARQEITYHYPEGCSDSLGNWTMRQVTAEHSETGNSADFRNGRRAFHTVEKRKITYY